jgi:hypothetical protein
MGFPAQFFGRCKTAAPCAGAIGTIAIFDAAFLANPYFTYGHLRAGGPIHWNEDLFGGASRKASVMLSTLPSSGTVAPFRFLSVG